MNAEKHSEAMMPEVKSAGGGPVASEPVSLAVVVPASSPEFVPAPKLAAGPSPEPVPAPSLEPSPEPEPECKMYGYARVSTRDQNLDRQLDALMEFGLDRASIYCDKASGKDFNRPKYKRLMRRLRTGDVLVIKSIDRLGRNYEEILEEWRFITKHRGAHVVVLDMPLLDTRETKDGLTGVFIADIVLQLLSYVAQIERENTKQRQAEGIAAAKARGVRFGRPALDRPEAYVEVRRANIEGKITRQQSAEVLGVSRSTFDKWIRQDNERAKAKRRRKRA